MAKKLKKKGFSISSINLEHFKRIEAYAAAINSLYEAAVNDYIKLSEKIEIDSTKPFYFSDYPTANKLSKAIIIELRAKIQAVIIEGGRKEWLFANEKADSFLESILDTTKLSKKKLAKYQDRNLDALAEFQKRKTDGLDLSKRIWNYTSQLPATMEMGLDIGIGEGKSSAELSRDLRSYLKDPDKLFRRVRDKHGNLVLSKRAKAFHPGQGVYRSSYKNAMRLTRTEINLAYRQADQLRYNSLDFIIGYEVKLSNNHTLNGVPFVDICDQLKGKYPKSFIFKGWHPQCRCQLFPILLDSQEFSTDEANELRAALRGTEYKKYSSPNEVKAPHKGFTDWVKENEERAKGWASQPYFIRDNFKEGKISGGLKLGG